MVVSHANSSSTRLRVPAQNGALFRMQQQMRQAGGESPAQPELQSIKSDLQLVRHQARFARR